jgi:hypothetical protein
VTLEEIFYVSQTVASVAVVGSLIFVGLQVRGAERAQRAIMQQGRADRTSAASLTLAQPDLARIWRKGLAGDTDLTPDEFSQWMAMVRSAFLSGEDSFLQYKAGQLDQRAFDSYVAGATFFLAQPGMRAAWKVSAPQFGSDFRAFGDSLVAGVPTRNHADTYAAWREALAAEQPAT